jgi:drug/metabolite transporter (DMT)-like permease
MGALSRLPLSKAYPFMALSFPTVAVLAVLLFHEELNTPKILGTSLIVLGAIILSRAPA